LSLIFYVYILFSHKDKLLYTGFTSNLKTRINRHKNGFVKATKHRLPIELIYYEAYSNKLDALRREKYLKGGKGKTELKIQLKEVFEDLKYKHR